MVLFDHLVLQAVPTPPPPAFGCRWRTACRQRGAVVDQQVQTALVGVFDALTVGVGVSRSDGRLVEVNDALLSLLAVRREEALGRTVPQLLGRELSVVRQGGETVDQHVALPDGRSVWVRVCRTPVRDDLVAWTLEDMTGHNLAEAALRERALRDPVTGLPNRYLLEDRLAHGLAQRDRVPMAVLFVDLDAFKHVNDTAGHRAGDEVLRQTGQRLVACARGGDTVGRWAGDEFVVLCEGIADPEAGHRISARITAACAQPFSAGGATFFLGASVGVALTGEWPADGADELVDRADRAMYVQKRARRPQ